MEGYEAFLLQLPRYGDRGTLALNPGPERVQALMTAMGNPHRRFSSIHVAGTNGKGSTASMISAILRANGFTRVGLYTSPHLVSMRERIRFDGAPVPSSWMTRAVAQYRDAMLTVRPSFFEAMTALAFCYFAEQQVSAAVIETGLGGRLDATNILHPRLSVITNVDYDHTHVLGHKLSAIAREKGGIIKLQVPLVTAARAPAALDVLKAMATERGAPLYVTHSECRWEAAELGSTGPSYDVVTPRTRYRGLSLRLAGAHQMDNTLLAIRVTELFADVPANAVRTGLRDVHQLSGLRARLETLQHSPRIVLDVAHNPAGLRAALRYLRSQSPERLFVLIGLVQSKDADGMARELFRERAIAYPCELSARRGLDAQVLSRTLRRWHVPVTQSGHWKDALAHARERATARDVILICGSHYLAGAVLADWQ